MTQIKDSRTSAAKKAAEVVDKKETKKVEEKPKVQLKLAKKAEQSVPIPKKVEPKPAVKMQEPKEAVKKVIAIKIDAKPKEQPKPKVKIKIQARPEEQPKKLSKPEIHKFKLFGVWDTTEIQVLDPGLKRYINLYPFQVPYTQGREIAKQFWKSKKPIVERLANKVMVSGHKGKKHWRSSGHNGGKKLLAMKIVMEAFKIIEAKTKKNPVEVFVRAIETGSPREGIVSIEYGGVRYPKAVDVSPQRRIDLVLRWLTQGAHQSAAAGKECKKKMPMALAEQILLTADGNNSAFCISKKIDLERQAAASR